MTQVQKTVLRSVAKEISRPTPLGMVIEQAKQVYPRMNLTQQQARSIIKPYRVGIDLFCGNRP